MNMGMWPGSFRLLVMDVWEHAYLLDYKPSERASYIDAFFANIDWKISGESNYKLASRLWWRQPKDDQEIFERIMNGKIEIRGNPRRRKS